MTDSYENHLDEKEARWFAIHTRFKSEKQVWRQLSNKGIHAYVPVQQFTRRWSRKIRVVELPLISCYVFVRIVASEYVRVLETEQVAGFVRFSKNLLSIPEEEMELMRRVIAAGLEVEAHPTAWHEGDAVEIAFGNLSGLRGKLVAIQGRQHVLVELGNLGYTLQLSVDPKFLKRPGE